LRRQRLLELDVPGPGPQLVGERLELVGELAATSSTRLVSAKQDVVSRLIHDAPSEGVAHPGGSAVPSGSSIPQAPGTGQL